MNGTVWGILAHVDAGKTTLSEALLYHGGQINSRGRVDHGDAFLDTDDLEKQRGITIYTKPARFSYKERIITLLDTPGHVDFATETERAIWAMDGCILLISGADGVQPHARTLFNLLQKNHVPTFIFVNKMDQELVDRDSLIIDIRDSLSENCAIYNDFESIAYCSDDAMEEYIETDSLSEATLHELIRSNRFYPIYMGSALKDEGVNVLLEGISDFSSFLSEFNNSDFGGRVYKIESLGSDTRLTFMKITGGSIRVKDTLSNGEKIDQIRLYSGEKYTQVDEADVGDVVALVGPRLTYSGQGLGNESDRLELLLNPVLQFKVDFLDDSIPKVAYQKLLPLNDEDPSLNLQWDESLQEIKINLMGRVQTEILTDRIQKMLDMSVEFGETGVLYKETLASSVEGVGHFEPLRHYAEVHLLMEPLEAGSGIQVEADVSTDDLALNWQRLIETHINEKIHMGTSIGAPITDIKFTIIGGRAHIKHTEGGDFREATYRAIRQGLMEAGTVILEPYYSFVITLPNEFVGRAMTDIEKMGGTFEVPYDSNGMTVFKGQAPAATIRNYQQEISAYSKGMGRIEFSFIGFLPAASQEAIIDSVGYNPELDTDNPSSSVFCSHGSPTIVPWNQVKECCHVPCRQNKNIYDDIIEPINQKRPLRDMDEWLDPEEIDKILYSATHNNVGKNPKKGWHYGDSSRVRRADSDYVYTAHKQIKPMEKFLLVDGYNLIYAWPELKEILDVNLDGARGRLLDILSNYKAMTDYNVIVVFDAYRVKGHSTEFSDYQNIHQVFTAEAQTADVYIERFTHEHGKKHDVTVVTSDGLEQIIIRGTGARLISSREFIDEVSRRAQELRERFDITT